MSPKIELLPCPFCGGKASLLWDQISGRTASFVKCSVCGCGARTQQVVISTEYSSDEKAAELWNRRVKDDYD